MTTIQQLRDARNANVMAVRSLNDRYPGTLMTPQIQQASDGYMATIRRLDGEIAAAERARDGNADPVIQAEFDAAYTPRRAPCDPLYNTYLREGLDGFSDEQRIAIRNTMSTTTGSQGGFTVPTLVAQRIYDVQKQFSSMRSVCGNLITTTGGALTVPRKARSLRFHSNCSPIPLSIWRRSSNYARPQESDG